MLNKTLDKIFRTSRGKNATTFRFERRNTLLIETYKFY